MNFQVTLTRPDGYVFKNAFQTMEEARDFAARAANVLMVGEKISIEAL